MYKAVLYRVTILMLLPLLLIACAGIQQVPDTTQGKIDFANATLTGINKGAINLINRDRLSLQDSINYQTLAQSASDHLDMSQRALDAGNNNLALTSWALANSILLEINKMIGNGGDR